MKYGSLNLFKEKTRLNRSPVVSALTALYSLSDTLAWQFQKLNLKFCFSLNLNQDPCVEDVPEVKGYDKYSNQWLRFSHSESTTNRLRISFAGVLSKQNVADASFPYCLCLVFKIPHRKTL